MYVKTCNIIIFIVQVPATVETFRRGRQKGDTDVRSHYYKCLSIRTYK